MDACCVCVCVFVKAFAETICVCECDVSPSWICLLLSVLQAERVCEVQDDSNKEKHFCETGYGAMNFFQFQLINGKATSCKI